MTFPNDPNLNRPYSDLDRTEHGLYGGANYTGWFIGAIVVIAIVVAVAVAGNRAGTKTAATSNAPTTTAIAPAPMPHPSTTGSGIASPPQAPSH
jgi:hypothetical protein